MKSRFGNYYASGSTTESGLWVPSENKIEKATADKPLPPEMRTGECPCCFHVEACLEDENGDPVKMPNSLKWIFTGPHCSVTLPMLYFGGGHYRTWVPGFDDLPHTDGLHFGCFCDTCGECADFFWAALDFCTGVCVADGVPGGGDPGANAIYSDQFNDICFCIPPPGSTCVSTWCHSVAIDITNIATTGISGSIARGECCAGVPISVAISSMAVPP
jgi:hypothetical protein